MQTSLAQMVALTCYGNAAIHGARAVGFPPSHSTCRFCELIHFTAAPKFVDSVSPVEMFADNPDTWMDHVHRRGIVGLRLHQHAQNKPGISDRNASAFVGGGRLWRIEALRANETSEFWHSRWEIGNQQAADHRIWQVTYTLDEVSPTAPFPLHALDALAGDLRAALQGIRAFAAANDCTNFVRCFDDALRALDDPHADVGEHKDLFPPGTLAPVAQALLRAAQPAWVFGGMGSWNDVSFEGQAQMDYEWVSNRLFNLLNDAIEAAATSSMPTAPRFA